MNTPKRNHFVPIMLLSRFTDDSGLLYWYLKNGTNRIVTPNLINIFVENHLYTTRNSSEQLDASIEKQFTELEGEFSPILEKLVDDATKNGLIYSLNDSDRSTFVNFILYLCRRTPANRPFVEQGMSNKIDEIPKAYEEFRGRPCTTEELEYVIGLKNQYGVHDVFAKFSGVNPKKSLVKKMMDVSIHIGVIPYQNENFIIGSKQIEKFNEWIPLDRKVAFKFTTLRFGSDKLTYFKDKPDILRINASIAKRSSQFAGPSEYLINPLINP